MKFSLKHRHFRFAVAASCAAFLTLAAASPTVAQQADSSKTTAQADTGHLLRTHPSSAIELMSPSLLSTATAGGRFQPWAGSGAGAAQSATPNAPLGGPRVAPPFPSVEPSLAQPALGLPDPAAANNHTIVISTFALVLIAVIVTIFIVK